MPRDFCAWKMYWLLHYSPAALINWRQTRGKNTCTKRKWAKTKIIYHKSLPDFRKICMELLSNKTIVCDLFALGGFQFQIYKLCSFRTKDSFRVCLKFIFFLATIKVKIKKKLLNQWWLFDCRSRRHTRCTLIMNWILLIIHDLRIYLRKGLMLLFYTYLVECSKENRRLRRWYSTTKR